MDVFTPARSSSPEAVPRIPLRGAIARSMAVHCTCILYKDTSSTNSLCQKARMGAALLRCFVSPTGRRCMITVLSHTSETPSMPQAPWATAERPTPTSPTTSPCTSDLIFLSVRFQHTVCVHIYSRGWRALRTQR